MLEWVAIPFSSGSSWSGNEPGSPALQADALPSEPPGKPTPCLFFGASSLENNSHSRLTVESTEVILHWMLVPLLQLPFLHPTLPHGCWSSRHHFSSVAQSCLTLCSPIDCRLLCPPPTARACSNSCSLSQGCHPTISSSVVPFSSHL